MLLNDFLSIIYSIIAIILLVPRVRAENESLDFQFNVTDWAVNYNERVSSECALQLNTSKENLAFLQMIDASSKSIDGLLAGNFFHLGNFEECYKIEVRNFHGKYCLGGISLMGVLPTGKIINDTVTLSTIKQPRLTSLTSINFGICLPSACTAIDATNFTANILEFSEQYCYSKDTEPALSPGAIATITILAVFLGIVTVATISDMVLFYKKSRKALHPLLIAFSAFTNGKKLISSTKNPDQLLCLNGIKAISMMWVIIGHIYSLALSGPVNNILDYLTWKSQAINMFIMGATVSVDTFLMVGGLLTAYTFLKASDKGIQLNIPLYYLHRYIRLTPALGITMLVTATLMAYFGTGPLWGGYKDTVEPCQTNWWLNLLYIQNYCRKNLCLAHSWYLAVDMQLFILSPLVLLPLKKWPKRTLYALGALIVLGVVVDLVIVKVYDLKSMQSEEKEFEYLWLYYYPVYTRYNVYLIGIVLGYFIYNNKTSGQQFTLSLPFTLLLWAIILAGLAACVFAGHDYYMSKTDVWQNAFYLSLNRPAWTVAVAGTVYLCITGYGGPINTFLSQAIFQFLAKLSYSMYLVHYTFITARYISSKDPIVINNFDFMLRFWGDFMCILLISAALSLVFESPMIVVEKYLFGNVVDDKKKAEEPSN